MRTFNIERAWEPYAPLMSLEEVAARIERPVALLGDPLEYLIPSIILVSDGPKLDALFLVTLPYVAVVDIQPPGEHRFHFFHRHRISQLTWEIRPANLQDEDLQHANYQVAILEIMVDGALDWTLHYVGHQPAGWIQTVSAAFAVGRTLRG